MGATAQMHGAGRGWHGWGQAPLASGTPAALQAGPLGDSQIWVDPSSCLSAQGELLLFCLPRRADILPIGISGDMAQQVMRIITIKHRLEILRILN